MIKNNNAQEIFLKMTNKVQFLEQKLPNNKV